MRSSILKIISIIFITAFLSSCATTSLVDTWHNSDSTFFKHHNKILVVYISRHGANSKNIEDALTNELKRRGVASVPAYSLFPDEKAADKLPMEKGLEESGADAVITMQMERFEKETHDLDVFPGWNDIEPTSYADSLKYNVTYEIGRVHVKFFDGKTGKLLWSATIRTSDPKNMNSLGKDLSAIVANYLLKVGLI
jgi:hypothetical protein